MANKPTLKPLTAEEKERQMIMAISQKRLSIAEMLLGQFAGARRTELTEDDGKKLVDLALAMSDYYVKKVFLPGVDDKKKNED